jgi:hypothetical protein
MKLKSRDAAVMGVVSLSFALAAPAWAASTGHSQTATVSCSGGSGFVVDANAYFGQQTETAAFNAAPPGESFTCGVTLNTP